MRKKLFLFLLMSVFLLPACSQQADEADKDAIAQPVLEAMFTCPNEELFDPDSISTIGVGTENALGPEEIQALNESISQAWESKFASSFTEDGFDTFITSGNNILYHAMAAVSGSSIQVDSIETAESPGDQSPSVYTLSLSVDADGQTQQAVVDCSVTFDDEAKISDLSITGDQSLQAIFLNLY